MNRVPASLRRALTVPDRPALDDLRQALKALDAQGRVTRGENDYDTILRAAALVRVAVAKLEKASLPDVGERTAND